MLAIIGGSGFYNLGAKPETEHVFTPYGDATVIRVRMLKEEVLFLPRHGTMHHLPPHKINYKGNVYALKKLGATATFATYASGIISKAKYAVGDLVLLEDFIGFNAPITFFDDFSSGIRHADFTEPFSKRMKEAVEETAMACRIKLKKGGIIATTIGPRFETKAEVAALAKIGANLVSMTNAYETTLMREAEIPFAAIAIGTNYATGIAKKQLNESEIMSEMTRAKGKINAIVSELAKGKYEV